jgi:hypothetical protein
MMISLLINVIWLDTSISTRSACLIWEFYFKKKIFHGLRSLASILPKPYVDLQCYILYICDLLIHWALSNVVTLLRYASYLFDQDHGHEQILHLKLATMSLEINTPQSWFSSSPEGSQRRHEISKKMDTWRTKYWTKTIAMPSRNSYKGEGKTAQKEFTSTSITHAQSWSTCMMYYLYRSNLWFCNRCIASTYPHIPHRAPLQPCIREGMRGTSLVSYTQISGWETSPRRGKTMDTLFKKKLFRNPKSAA